MRRTLAKGGHAYIEVCYGTSKFQSYSHTDLIIANLTDLVEMRLPQATVFQLGRTAIIPWAEEWVSPLDGIGPRISHLTPAYCEYLAHLMARHKKGRR